MIRIVFANQGDRASCSEHQESKAGYFQPELVGNSGKVPQRRTGSAHHCAEGPAALYMLPGYAGHDSEFARARDIRHSSRF